MCVILATKQNGKPSLETLKLAERANPHGGGIAWLHGGRVCWAKGLTAEEIHGITRREHGPFVIHFRIASVGKVCAELCHPFPVSGNASVALSGSAHTVLFQNGTWQDWEQGILASSERLSAVIPTGPFSDARAAAWMVAQFGPAAFRVMGGKFMTMDKRGWKIQAGQWYERRGLVCSNTYWLPSVVKPVEKRRYTADDLENWNRRENEGE